MDLGLIFLLISIILLAIFICLGIIALIGFGCCGWKFVDTDYEYIL